MTEEEAFALDKYYTDNPPKVDPAKARIRIPMIRLDDVTAKYLYEKALSSNRTPADIVSDMVQKELAKAV